MSWSWRVVVTLFSPTKKKTIPFSNSNSSLQLIIRSHRGSNLCVLCALCGEKRYALAPWGMQPNTSPWRLIAPTCAVLGSCLCTYYSIFGNLWVTSCGRSDHGLKKNPQNLSSESYRQIWRRGGDSNPRWTCAHTTFPRLHHRPLGHPSVYQSTPAMVPGAGLEPAHTHV